MPDTPRRRVWATRAAAALVLCVAAASGTLLSARSRGSFIQQPTSAESPLQQSLPDGFRKIEAGEVADARAIFERAIELARADGDVGREAEAYRGLGRARSSALAFAEG